MYEHVEFNVISQQPTLDHYRRDWRPDSAPGLCGIWLGGIVSDAAGNDYWGVRGCDDFIAGMTHVVSPICGFRPLRKGMDVDAPHLFDEYSTLDWFEPMQLVETDSSVQLSYQSGRIERDADGFHWYDASGRWELHGQTVSDIVMTHVPPQQGIDADVYYRHELMYATGMINGTEVSGYTHQDFAYGPAGTIYTELPIVRHLQGMWVSWLHEFADGELGGGSFWQGRDSVSFGPGYQLKSGATTVHKDVVARPTFSDAGKLIALDTSMGSDTYTMSFDSSGSPLHTFGPLTATSSGRSIARSWCWSEYGGGLITPDLLDMATQAYALARGR